MDIDAPAGTDMRDYRWWMAPLKYLSSLIIILFGISISIPRWIFSTLLTCRNKQWFIVSRISHLFYKQITKIGALLIRKSKIIAEAYLFGNWMSFFTVTWNHTVLRICTGCFQQFRRKYAQIITNRSSTLIFWYPSDRERSSNCARNWWLRYKW